MLENIFDTNVASLELASEFNSYGIWERRCSKVCPYPFSFLFHPSDSSQPKKIQTFACVYNHNVGLVML